MKDFLDELLVVLVVYDMRIVECPAYYSLTNALTASSYVVSLFVYDNSVTEQQPPGHTCWEVNYFHDRSNPGVSKAYNMGCRLAIETHKKWMLLLDQDTFFPRNCFDEYFKAAMVHPIAVPLLKDNFGIVSPLQFYYGGGQRVKDFENHSVLKLKDFLFHNSGLLVSTKTFERVGGYDENLRLDFSDFAFVHRLRRHEKEFAIADFSCLHRLATSETTSLDERLSRFESYVSAGKYFMKIYASCDWLLLPRIFLRGVKLCLQYRTHKFMTPFFWHK
jgi:rhamnosyltransferase